MQESNIDTPVMQPVQKTDKKMITILIILLVVLIVGVGAIIIILLTRSTGDSAESGDTQAHKALTPEYLRNYCNEKGLTINEHSADSDQGLTIVCEEEMMKQGEWITGVTSSDDLPGYKNDIFLIHYAKYEKPILEVPEMQFGYTNIANRFQLLAETENYKKFYEEKNDLMYSGGATYVIFDEDVYFDISAKNNKSVREFLMGAGYPDDKWGVDKEGTSSEDDLSSQMDTARRNDVARVLTSLVQYQTNNRGMLPKGPSYWKGSGSFNCGDGDAACSFVESYMNSNSINNFKDPSGEFYSLFITDNLMEGDIMLSYGGNNSKLIKNDSGYTIGGDSPFSEHVIYIIPGAACSDNVAVKSTSKRNVAVLYQLETNNSVYCKDI